MRLYEETKQVSASRHDAWGSSIAIAIVLLTFSGNPDIGLILIVPALYSLFIVLISTLVTFWFRRANLAAEQKIPSLL